MFRKHFAQQRHNYKGYIKKMAGAVYVDFLLERYDRNILSELRQSQENGKTRRVSLQRGSIVIFSMFPPNSPHENHHRRKTQCTETVSGSVFIGWHSVSL